MLVCWGNQGPVGKAGAPTQASEPFEPLLSCGFQLREQQGHGCCLSVKCSEMESGTDGRSHL